MKLEGVKLKLRRTLLIFALSLAACNEYPIPVYFVDTDLSEVREHSVVDRANVIISEQPIAIHPLTKANGLICTDPVTFRKMKEEYLNSFKPILVKLVLEKQTAQESPRLSYHQSL